MCCMHSEWNLFKKKINSVYFPLLLTPYIYLDNLNSLLMLIFRYIITLCDAQFPNNMRKLQMNSLVFIIIIIFIIISLKNKT